ncbi:hypothetical protein [Enterococcus sp. LJL51]|uniref:hypothetical protein n=1 Tax=Enterococcus sp. LJL51 TaxID=3416656 RepID=UPI003CEC4E53
MNKKIIVSIIVVLVLILSIGGGFYVVKQKEKEAQIVEWEKVVAKQIKNTFADVKEVHFSEMTSENSISGMTGVSVNIVTDKDSMELSVTLPPDIENSTLRSYVGIAPQKGVTENRIKVIYTDGNEEEI